MGARLPAAVRRRQLLDVAIGVFSTKGFHATSMNDVAEAAGVTKPVLYQHFRSKRDLYLAALNDVGDRLRQSIEKVTAEASSPREQVTAGLRAYFRFVDENTDAFSLLFGGGSRLDAEFSAAARAVEAAVAASTAERMDVTDLSTEERTLLGHAVVGLAEGACRHWLAEGRQIDPETLADQVSQLAWAGLRSIGNGGAGGGS
ncbi:MAG: TetR/AcrR family transcriptional regulator [Acidimicrobiales bacterium]|nr:TetR/AcrR family transcriptional regulator [Acidimicrobiales bacterium]